MFLQSLIGILFYINTSDAIPNTNNVLNSIEVAKHIEKRIEIASSSAVSAPPVNEKVKSKTRAFDGAPSTPPPSMSVMPISTRMDQQSSQPSSIPSEIPSEQPSSAPSEVFSVQPSISSHPSSASNAVPSAQPSISSQPHGQSSISTSYFPSNNPSITSISILSKLKSPSPSVQPSLIFNTISSDLINLTRSPTSKSCIDYAQKFAVEMPSGEWKNKDCGWAAENTEVRCSIEGISNKCPVTCNSCQSVAPTTSPTSKSPTSKSCHDYAQKFAVEMPSGDWKNKDCGWAAENTELRCSIEGISSKCPVTCNSCQAVQFSSTIPLEMTSTSNGMMSESNISLLQDTLNALLFREE
jgi:hypothetical protein